MLEKKVVEGVYWCAGVMRMTVLVLLLLASHFIARAKGTEITTDSCQQVPDAEEKIVPLSADEPWCSKKPEYWKDGEKVGERMKLSRTATAAYGKGLPAPSAGWAPKPARLIIALKDEDKYVREAAKEALEKIHKP